MTCPEVGGPGLPEKDHSIESMISVVVVILTYNQRKTLLRCLNSFSEVSHPPHKILVWDNGSTDDTAERVTEQFPSVRVHYHKSNLGVASGRNAAAKLAMKEFAPRYLLFLDNDTTVTPDFLDCLVSACEKDPRVALTTGKILDMSENSRIYGAGGCLCQLWLGRTTHIGFGEVDRGQYDKIRPCLPSGGCLLVRSSAFVSLNGFDSTFDPYGPEDLDFSLRAVKAGLETLYIPESVIFHPSRPSRTLDGGRYNSESIQLRIRHWLAFLSRHGSLIEKLGFFVFGAPYRLASLCFREGRQGNLWPVLKGLIQGIFPCGESRQIGNTR